MFHLKPWLQLVRLPAVFTAFADILLGYLLTQNSWTPVVPLLLLLGATTGLYLSGMVWNDVFDVAEDTRDRPTRPIPAGHVSLGAARLLATLLMVLGVSCAALVPVVGGGGFLAASSSELSVLSISAPKTLVPSSLVAALTIAVLVLAYNSWLKRSVVWGPLAMGGCRYFNIMLGASAVSSWEGWWSRPQLLAALGVGIYIAGVTGFAREEAKTSQRRSLAGGLILQVLGLTTLGGLMWSWPGRAEPAMALLLLGLVAFPPARNAWAAWQNPSPLCVQTAIRSMLISLILFDATIAYWHTGGGPYPAAIAALVIPGFALSRLIRVT